MGYPLQCIIAPNLGGSLCLTFLIQQESQGDRKGRPYYTGGYNWQEGVCLACSWAQRNPLRMF